MRHALSHLKGRRKRCILCGKLFKQAPFAKKHILEHIDEMAKQKKTTDVTGCGVANGKGLDLDRQVLDESLTPEPTTPTPDTDPTDTKDKARPKLAKTKPKPVLDRDDRIIKNLRSLIKKMALLQKGKESEVDVASAVNFTDEQVLITDSQVIIRDLSVVEGEGRAPGAWNGGNIGNVVYFVCPAESCDRVFVKINGPFLKHMLKFHLKEEKVLEKAFVWSKHKCSLCIG